MSDTTYERTSTDGKRYRSTSKLTSGAFAGGWQLFYGTISEHQGKKYRMTYDVFLVAQGETEARAWVDEIDKG